SCSTVPCLTVPFRFLSAITQLLGGIRMNRSTLLALAIASVIGMNVVASPAAFAGNNCDLNDGDTSNENSGGSVAAGTDAIACGNGNDAQGAESVAIGQANSASGAAASALGYVNTADGDDSSAV